MVIPDGQMGRLFTKFLQGLGSAKFGIALAKCHLVAGVDVEVVTEKQEQIGPGGRDRGPDRLGLALLRTGTKGNAQ